MQQMLLLTDGSARSRELELNLKEAFPGLRLLVATTYAEARKHSVHTMLCEPLNEQELIQAVRQALTVCSERTSHLRKLQTPPATGPSTSPGGASFNRHRAINRLSGLLLGLHAYGADLRDAANSAQSILAIVSQYEESLISIVEDLSNLLGHYPQAPGNIDPWQKERG